MNHFQPIGPLVRRWSKYVDLVDDDRSAILALPTSDAVLYRRAWPLALPPLLTGLAAILVLLARA